MNSWKNTALAILCGGQSRRLGSDKGLYAPLGDETLICRMIRVLGDGFPTIQVVVRDEEQAVLYRQELDRNLAPAVAARVEIVRDTDIPGLRPDAALTGIHTALSRTTREGIVAVPVDQVGVRPLHLRHLQSLTASVRCFQAESSPIPFPSYWNKSVEEKLLARLQAGALCVKGALLDAPAEFKAVGEYGDELAFNGNTKEELSAYFGSPLFDPFARRLHYLRFSLTEACNLSCTYCLPEGFPEWYRHKARLGKDDLETLLRGFRRLGFRKVRFTGGEPTVHPGSLQAVKTARRLGYEWIAMTTNGLLIEDLDQWIDAGLNQINVSMDSLSEDAFFAVTGSREVNKVRRLVEVAADKGLVTKVNAVLIRSKNGDTKLVEEMIDWALERPMTLRFIELMDTKLNSTFSKQERVLGTEILPLLTGRGLVAARNLGRSPILDGPSTDYQHADYPGQIGLINPLSCNFCDKCNRLRLTARGRLKLCLFGDDDLPLRLDSPESVEQDVRALIGVKPEKHDLENGQVGNVATFRTIGG